MERFSQGELTFVKLPEDADMSGKAFADTDTDGRWIIGHSETGHHHVMDRAPVQIVERDNAPIGVRILRLIVAEPVACEHLRSFDTTPRSICRRANGRFAPPVNMTRWQRLPAVSPTSA